MRTTRYADGVYTDETRSESPNLFLKGDYSYHYTVTKTDSTVELADAKENQHLTFSKDTEWPEAPKEYDEINSKLCLHPTEFVEYELHRPKVDGDLGWYHELHGEILDEPDEILLTYFSELFAK